MDQTLRNPSLGATAVVVGAGMGGMMAAQVLSRYFDEVIVVEKDALPSDAQTRMGVPQSHHTHALLEQGRRNLEALFPGLVDELVARGAVRARGGLDFHLHDAAGWQPNRDLGLLVLTMSRPLLETTVRDFLKRNPRVTIRDNTRVEGWVFTSGALAGVAISDQNGAATTLETDFAIDAAGRNSASLSWLEAGGLGPVEETTLEIGTGYASAIFKKPKGRTGDVDSLVINGADPDTRGGFAFSIENDCWSVSLTGRFDQQPSGDPDKFLDFAKSLCAPDIHDWISQGQRVTPIKVYKAPISRWRRYDKLERYPQGVLPLGDALAHVNPLYGQGMTLASIHAMALDEVLAERAASGGDLQAIARPYFEQVHRFTAQVWGGLETVEFGYAGTKGERPADIDSRIAYARGLRRLMIEDAEVHGLMVRVGYLVLPRDVLGRPDIVERVTQIIAGGGPAA